MPKTIADYSPAKRDHLVGMWCDMQAGNRKGLAILTGHYRSHVDVFMPHLGFTIHVNPESITPRPDLPRAWKPDGAPVTGEWKTRSAGLQPGPGRGLTHHEMPARRFITDWEEDPELYQGREEARS